MLAPRPHKRLLDDKSLDFFFGADEAGIVSGASWMVGELLRNLLLNAIQFSPAEAELRVEIRVGADGPRVDITDKGPGIEREQLTTLFEALATVTGRSGASSLGMAICKEIGDAIGATLRFSRRRCRARGSARPSCSRDVAPDELVEFDCAWAYEFGVVCKAPRTFCVKAACRVEGI